MRMRECAGASIVLWGSELFLVDHLDMTLSITLWILFIRKLRIHLPISPVIHLECIMWEIKTRLHMSQLFGVCLSCKARRSWHSCLTIVRGIQPHSGVGDLRCLKCVREKQYLVSAFKWCLRPDTFYFNSWWMSNLINVVLGLRAWSCCQYLLQSQVGLVWQTTYDLRFVSRSQ